MKILIDMNLPPRWVQVFAEADWEAAHWSRLGEPTASDREIMAWARENG
jgi:predicted nuclease of predicted toxin-antitoxin system